MKKVIIAIIAVTSFATGLVAAPESKLWASKQTGAAPGPAAHSQVHKVRLTARGPEPSAVAIPVGRYVEFAAQDGKQHLFSQGGGNNQAHQQALVEAHEHLSGKDSGIFGPGEAYKVQFHSAGTYNFHDHLNPKISVTVVVYRPHQ